MQKENVDSVEGIAFMQRNMAIRLMMSFILIPVVLGVVYMGGIVMTISLLLLAFALSREWVRMMIKPQMQMLNILFYVILFGGFAFSFFERSWLTSLYMIALPILFYSVIRMRQIASPMLVTFGLFYIFLPIYGAIWVRNMTEDGFLHIVFLLSVVIATDSGAYFSGKFFKGPKLAPKISPNKTISGAIGGIVFACLMAYLMILITGYQPPFPFVMLVVLIAISSQIGDLFESHMKRRSGVKDSGTLIPGHGGALDRIDGYLFALPVFALIIYIT